MEKPTNDPNSSTTRRVYQRPQLRELGDVRELTRGGTSGSAEQFGGRRP